MSMSTFSLVGGDLCPALLRPTYYLRHVSLCVERALSFWFVCGFLQSRYVWGSAPQLLLKYVSVCQKLCWILQLQVTCFLHLYRMVQVIHLWNCSVFLSALTQPDMLGISDSPAFHNFYVTLCVSQLSYCPIFTTSMNRKACFSLHNCPYSSKGG